MRFFRCKFYVFDMKMVWNMIKHFLRNFGLLKIQGWYLLIKTKWFASKKCKSSHSPSQQTRFYRGYYNPEEVHSSQCETERLWSLLSTYWSVQLPLLIHAEVESTVHASNADKAHGYTDKFQNAYKTIGRRWRAGQSTEHCPESQHH